MTQPELRKPMFYKERWYYTSSKNTCC